MTKQEFLAMSLPYGLWVLVEEWGVELVIGISTDEVKTTEDDASIDICLPTLHPLSDLTKEIEHKGEKFVPIEEILNYPLSYYDDKEDALISIQNYTAQISWWTVQILIEWHFDIAGLIEKNEAIDVNTLTENPYK